MMSMDFRKIRNVRVGRKLESAMRNCRSEGFTEEELKALVDAVAAFGKGMVRWVAKVRVDAERKMFAVQMP